MRNLHVLGSGVYPQVVLDQTHDHLQIVAGASKNKRKNVFEKKLTTFIELSRNLQSYIKV